MSDDNGVSVQFGTGGCMGCLGIVVACILLWAFVFGVTVGGKHYGIHCSREKGVEVQK